MAEEIKKSKKTRNGNDEIDVSRRTFLVKTFSLQQSFFKSKFVFFSANSLSSLQKEKKTSRIRILSTMLQPPLFPTYYLLCPNYQGNHHK